MGAPWCCSEYWRVDRGRGLWPGAVDGAFERWNADFGWAVATASGLERLSQPADLGRSIGFEVFRRRKT
jgi:hypothetical protein